MPGPKDVKFRLVETVSKPSLAGPTRTVLPITEVMQGLNLLLSGSVTIATNDATSLAPEGILSLIRNIKIEATSSSRREVGVIKNADFASMYTLQRFLRNVAGLKTTLSAATKQAGTAVKADLQLDFEFPHSSDPRQTLLNTTELSTLTLVVDWGDANDILVVGTAVVTFPTMAIKVSARELTDVESKRKRYGINSFSYIEKSVGTAQSRLLVDLKRGYLLRGFLVKQFTRAAGTNFHTPVDTVINSIALELNREVKVKFDDWNVLQGQNIYDYKMGAAIPGYAFIDLMEDGRYDKLIDTRMYRDVNVVLDIATVADSVIRIYPVEIVPSVL